MSTYSREMYACLGHDLEDRGYPDREMTAEELERATAPMSSEEKAEHQKQVAERRQNSAEFARQIACGTFWG